MEPVSTFLGAIKMVKAGLGGISFLNSLLSDDSMASIFTELGDLDYQDAREALSHARKSNAPERNIAEAVFHLRKARSKYQRAAQHETKWFFGIWNLGKLDKNENLEKYIRTSLLMTWCNCYLRDFGQARLVAEEIRECFDYYRSLQLDQLEAATNSEFAWDISDMGYDNVRRLNEHEESAEQAKVNLHEAELLFVQADRELKELERLLQVL